MASTAGAFKGALVIAVCVMLLHSSMGQQPDPGQDPASAPVLSCGDICDKNCNQKCNGKFEAEHGKCSTEAEFYDNCFKGCTASQCKGNSHTPGSCTENILRIPAPVIAANPAVPGHQISSSDACHPGPWS
ncbi:unnamed protein product [Urochloa humidicola]